MLQERSVDRKIATTAVFTDGKLSVTHQNFETERQQHREGENK